MKKLIYLFSLLVLFQSSLHANNINELEIEGFSIGDSLLKHLSRSEILSDQEFIYQNNKNSSNEIAVVSHTKNLKLYDQLQISFKTNDNKFTVVGLSAFIAYESELAACYKKQDEIFEDLIKFFGNVQSQRHNGEAEDHSGYPPGEVKLKRHSIYLSKGKRSNLEILCIEAINYKDRLSVSLKSDEYNEWLYKLNK